MTLDDLVKANKVSYFEGQVYRLFAISDEGRAWFLNKTHETFMDCPPPVPNNMTGAVLGYSEGRRAIFREIHMIIEKIQSLMQRALTE